MNIAFKQSMLPAVELSRRPARSGARTFLWWLLLYLIALLSLIWLFRRADAREDFSAPTAAVRFHGGQHAFDPGAQGVTGQFSFRS